MSTRGCIFVVILSCCLSQGQGECPLGYCTLQNDDVTNNQTCNIETDVMCSSEIYCNGNGQCFKDRGSPNVFCNCSEERYGDSCQYNYTRIGVNSTECVDLFGLCNENRGSCRNETCQCWDGFRGYNCEIRVRVPDRFNWCRNGGRMWEQGRDTICTCPCGFAGDRCQYRVDSNNTIIIPTTPTPTTTTLPKDCLYRNKRGYCKCTCRRFGRDCEFSTNTSSPDYKDMCRTFYSTHCFNGGSCYINEGMCESVCHCTDKYTGPRCKEKIVNRSKSSLSSYSIGILLIPPIIFTVFVTAVYVGLCVRANRLKRKAQREQASVTPETRSSPNSLPRHNNSQSPISVNSRSLLARNSRGPVSANSRLSVFGNSRRSVSDDSKRPVFAKPRWPLFGDQTRLHGLRSVCSSVSSSRSLNTSDSRDINAFKKARTKGRVNSSISRMSDVSLATCSSSRPPSTLTRVDTLSDVSIKTPYSVHYRNRKSSNQFRYGRRNDRRTSIMSTSRPPSSLGPPPTPSSLDIQPELEIRSPPPTYTATYGALPTYDEAVEISK